MSIFVIIICLAPQAINKCKCYVNLKNVIYFNIKGTLKAGYHLSLKYCVSIVLAKK